MLRELGEMATVLSHYTLGVENIEILRLALRFYLRYLSGESIAPGVFVGLEMIIRTSAEAWDLWRNGRMEDIRGRK